MVVIIHTVSGYQMKKRMHCSSAWITPNASCTPPRTQSSMGGVGFISVSVLFCSDGTLIFFFLFTFFMATVAFCFFVSGKHVYMYSVCASYVLIYPHVSTFFVDRTTLADTPPWALIINAYERQHAICPISASLPLRFQNGDINSCASRAPWPRQSVFLAVGPTSLWHQQLTLPYTEY